MSRFERVVMRHLVTVVLLLTVLFVPLPAPGATVSPADAELDHVTWVTTQGHWRGTGGGDLVGVTRNGSTIYEHDRYAQYYDVDPINESHLLVAAGGRLTGQWALLLDWRRDEVVTRVSVPPDTHDVDRLPNGDWVVADKESSVVYEVDPRTGERGWTYDVAAAYDGPPENGVEGDFTHLNDVDPVRNGSAYLLSPRNFDRVLLVDRRTKETEWVLGAQGDHETLARQHNPMWLQEDAVLVADSENHRVIEYHRSEGEWRTTWAYAGNLSWPRDADRLPNGNTLIVDSKGHRVLEVTPDGTVVWEHDERLHPYDAERQSLGNEPGGPTLTQGVVAESGNADENGLVDALEWVPPRPVVAVLVLLGWVGTEVRSRRT
jgi:hypothetical protein